LSSAFIKGDIISNTTRISMISGEPLIDEEVIAAASGDIVDRIEITEKLARAKNSYQGHFYSDLIFMLTNIRLEEDGAKHDWQNILRHKHFMSEKLGRNVGIRVATLDYYTNITRQMASPVIVDLTEYSKTVKESITDPLTFCYNRRYFDYVLNHAIAKTTEKEEALSLMMIDIDYFKNYNDLNGHLMGDFALIEVSRILHVISRRGDVVARWGGEEFTIVLPNLTAQEAMPLAEKIRAAVEDFRFPNEQSLPGKRLTISIGVAQHTETMKSTNDLIEAADNALYRAKNEGRNCVRKY
jgi:diguanylate cyclase (GGDEF)-like protein